MRAVWEGSFGSGDLVTDLAAGVGSIATVNCDLIDQPFYYQDNMNLSGLSVASYPGYAQQSPGFFSKLPQGAGINPGVWVARMHNAVFPTPTSGPDVTVYGLLISYVGTAGPAPWAVIPFDAPIVLPGGHTSLTIGNPSMSFRPRFWALGTTLT